MTKDEMITLLRSVNCDENTVTAMSNAYELGFEQGAQAGELMSEVIDVAVQYMRPECEDFWAAFEKLRGVA